MLTREAAWSVLGQVPDPEVPVISVTELGIVRAVDANDDGISVTVTPTYTGCPAMEAIEDSIRDALMAAGAARVEIRRQLAPTWTTDWIDASAREKLRDHGIAPPGAHGDAESRPLVFSARVDCPRCGSRSTERLSQFGSTACKALYRCRDCREPFEYFKPI